MRLGTSLRSRSAAQTFRVARRVMPALGITRVTDITRMDRLGVPVCASVRPRGSTLAVHAGKGLTLDDARTGALMEAVEFALSERDAAAAVPQRPTARALAAQLPAGLRLADLAPRVGVRIDPRRIVEAVPCDELIAGTAALLPAETALMPFVPPSGVRLFASTTNGLASGNTRDEATLHGLFEVLERDVLAMHLMRDASWRVDNAGLPSPFAAWAQAWQRDGIELIVRALPNDVDLPCFEAHLHEATNPDVRLTSGSGLHFDRGIALARAITEAAQSRLTTIHGARDDITHFYARHAPARRGATRRAEARLLETLRSAPAPGRFEQVPQHGFTGSTAALKALLARLQAAGFEQVFRRDLGGPACGVDLQGLHVVKVVVPRCEALLHGTLRMGPRLLARAVGRG